MLRFPVFLAFFAAVLCAPVLFAQSDSALESYFTGKQVLIKIDMPGTQKGINLRYNKPSPMDWKEYGSRMKQFGASIRKGDVARITAFNVKAPDNRSNGQDFPLRNPLLFRSSRP